MIHDNAISVSKRSRPRAFDRGVIETLPIPLHRRTSCIAATIAIGSAMLWSAIFALARIVVA
jgi:hypothetical protein